MNESLSAVTAEASVGSNVPDLPGCLAAGEIRKEVLQLIRESIEFHIEGLRVYGQPVPSAASSIKVVRAATKPFAASDR